MAKYDYLISYRLNKRGGGAVNACGHTVMTLDHPMAADDVDALSVMCHPRGHPAGVVITSVFPLAQPAQETP